MKAPALRASRIMVNWLMMASIPLWGGSVILYLILLGWYRGRKEIKNRGYALSYTTEVNLAEGRDFFWRC